jgi:hypothetical protein
VNAADIVNRESAKLEKFKLGDTVRIANGVPYAGHVDNNAFVYERTYDALLARLARRFKK